MVQIFTPRHAVTNTWFKYTSENESYRTENESYRTGKSTMQHYCNGDFHVNHISSFLVIVVYHTSRAYVNFFT